jgi:hypothetical protein
VIKVSGLDYLTMRKIVEEFKGNPGDSDNGPTKPGLDLGYWDV